MLIPNGKEKAATATMSVLKTRQLILASQNTSTGLTETKYWSSVCFRYSTTLCWSNCHADPERSRVNLQFNRNYGLHVPYGSQFPRAFFLFTFQSGGEWSLASVLLYEMQQNNAQYIKSKAICTVSILYSMISIFPSTCTQ